MKRESLPKSMQALFWSGNVKALDLRRDKGVVIHRILSSGSLGDLKWLFNHYPKSAIRKVFISCPKKYYTESALNFAGKHLVPTRKTLDKKKYVKNIH